MSDENDRRNARRDWPVVARKLEDDDVPDTSTVAERIASMWPLALEAYSLAGIRIPTYDRKNTPARLFAPGEPRDDEA